MTPSRYQDIEAARIRVLSGVVDSVKGPVVTMITDPWLLDIALFGAGDMSLPTPSTYYVFAYVFASEMLVGNRWCA